jgi:hypothetical protein
MNIFNVELSRLPSEEYVLRVAGRAQQNTVERGLLRYDWQNPKCYFAQKLLEEVWRAVEKYVDRSPILSRHRVDSMCLAVVHPGAPEQEWHCDLDGDTSYFTLIVPLTSERSAGGTQFNDPRTGRRTERARRGKAYYFDGDVIHRGARHLGQCIRVFAAFTLVPEDWTGEDLNIL